MTGDKNPYEVQKTDDGRHVIIGQDGRTRLKCGPDRTNAEHYAAIMNETWKAGFKAGYREGRSQQP